jgi:hypothetical protein
MIVAKCASDATVLPSKYLYGSAIDCCISKNEGHRRTGVCFAVNRRTKLIPDLEWAPWGGQRSGGGFDHRPGVAILELLGAETTQR